jgi:hypothetical protein
MKKDGSSKSTKKAKPTGIANVKKGPKKAGTASDSGKLHLGPAGTHTMKNRSTIIDAMQLR